jgi:hypothetical protein
MKKINVKRLAALGTGIALLSAALAPVASAITLSRGDIINTTNGMPAVDIVVGANAASDAIWAGNIAAKIAQLAYTETAVSATPQWKEGVTTGEGVTPEVSVTDLSVDLVIGGETTYAAGTAYVFDDNYLNSVSSQPELNNAEYGQSKLSSLLNETWSYTYNGSSYTQTVKEYIGISADAKFEKHKDVKDLVLYLDDEGDFYYKVTFSAGIPYDFTKADQNTITVPFFGKKYTVLSASSSELKLIDESNKYTYYNGERITGLTGKGSYAGQSLEVEFVTLTYNQAQGTYYAKFNLYDGEGNLIDTRDGISSDTFLENVFYVNGEYPLETSIYIQSLGKEDVSGKGYIVVTVGTNTIQLKDGDKYPYDPTVTSSSKKYWKVDLHTGTGTVGNESSRPVIDYIKIYNAAVEGYSKWDRKMPIYAETDSLTGHSEDSTAVFLNGEPESTLGYGFAKVKFYGFKHNETTTELKIADHKIYYTDTGDTQHEIPLYISGLDSTSEEEFVFDKSGNKKYYFRISTSTPNVTVCDGDLLNGIAIDISDPNSDGDWDILTDAGYKELTSNIGSSFDINGVKWVIVDDNTTSAACATLDTNGYFEIWDESFDSGSSASNSVQGYNGAPLNYKFYFDAESAPDESTNFAVVKLEGDNTQDYYYAYFYDADTGEVWLLYDPKTSLNEKNGYNLTFSGTDTDEDQTVEVYAYVPNESELGGGTSGEFYIAKFTLTEPGNHGTGYIYVDTEDGSLPPIGNTNLSNYSYEFTYTNSDTSQTLQLTNYNEADNIQTAWSDYGSKFDISNDYFVAVIPENREYIKLAVEGPEATVEVSGEELSAAEGETVTTSAGTKITIKKINYTASVTPSVCPAGGVTLDDVEVTVVPDKVKQIVPVGQLVYTDEEAFGDKPHILIGGWKANKLVAEKLDEMLLSDGTRLDERLTKPGDYVVDKLETGDIIVAGYTAADTVAAAKELIAELEKLLE